MDLRESADDPEDILSASLESLYDLRPITLSTAGSIFTYPIKPGRISHRPPNQTIELATPDTDRSNWTLHASSIWASALFVADHVEELHIDAPRAAHRDEGKGVVHVLELGAGAGLPSILIASMYPHARIAASDYPDDRLIQTLADNVRRNAVSDRCCAVPHAWGTDPGALLPPTRTTACDSGFDVVLAADTLWNPELHAPFVDTLSACLGHAPHARAHLVAGLHTGRYTLQSFLDHAHRRGLALEVATEREVGGAASRAWDVARAEGEDERERRRWVVWMIFKWSDSKDAPRPL